MATIDMLERLRMIQNSFAQSNSLEATVATERIDRVVDRTEQIIRQRAFLRDERRRLRLSSERLTRQQLDLKGMRDAHWLPTGLFHHDTPDRHVFLNVGGMVFECPERVLLRDESSILANLLTPLSHIQPDSEGMFYFDRDWWLFRYIMMFMRDGTLPDDRQLLAMLYKESKYWRLSQLQRAIEEEKLHLSSGPLAGVNAGPGLASMTDVERQRWWRQNANSFSQRQEATAAPPKKKDWWVDTEYNGKLFGPLSTDPTKVVTEGGAPDASAMLSGTWSRLP